MNRKKRKQRRRQIVRTGDSWVKWKGSQLRSSWLARAKKTGGGLVRTVPQPSTIRTWLRKRSPPVCYYRETPLKEADVEIDHLQPISRGGTFSLRNAAITSKFLNRAKGAMTEEEFKSLLELIDKWEDGGYTLLSRLIAGSSIFKRK